MTDILSKVSFFGAFFFVYQSLKNELHVLDSVSFEENHNNERPQSQNKTSRRMPILQLWFLQNKSKHR